VAPHHHQRGPGVPEAHAQARTPAVHPDPADCRGHTLGSLWLASTYSDRPFDDTEFTLARDLGRLAALHIDNARLYDQAKRAIALRDEVLGVVAHDLRNPVGTVRMATDLLLDPKMRGSDAALERHLGIIRRQADRMERLIRDLLDVTRIEAGRLSVAAEPTPTGELIRDAVDALSPLVIEAGLHLAVQAGDDLPRVQADRERVAQVFSNLVGNAIKFTPAGGTLTLRAEPRESAVRFAVADTGPGIAADQVRHIFDRFWQAGHADGRGAGLGLAIVKGIVEAHGGEIEVESEPGHGTSFFFTLPRVQ
jgi:signal transduction histidine kinase